jgi:hypothetical protein
MNGPGRSSRPAVSVDSQSQLDYPAIAAMLEEQLKIQLDPAEKNWIVNDPESVAATDSVNRLWKKRFYQNQ